MKKSFMGIALLFCASSSFATSYFNHFAVDGQTYPLDMRQGSTAYLDVDENSQFNFNGINYYHLKTAHCVAHAIAKEGGAGTIRFDLKGLKYSSKGSGNFDIDKRQVVKQTVNGEITAKFDVKSIGNQSWVFETTNLKDSYSFEIDVIGTTNINKIDISCSYN